MFANAGGRYVVDGKTNARLNEALAALQAGNTVTAHFALKRVLRRDPDNLQARLLLAEVRLQEGNLAEATSLAEALTAAQIPSHDPFFRGSLADLCLRCEMYFEASALYGPLCEQSPENESLRYRAGTAAFKSGQLDAAEQHFLHCAKLRPEHPASFLQLGHIYRAMRDFKRAETSYLDYIGRSADEKARGYWSLADLRRHDFTDETIAAMGKYLSTCPEPGLEASIMNFALGIAAEQQDNYELALQHYRLANDIQTQLRPFRSAAYLQLTNGLMAANLPSVPLQEATSGRPLFVVGLPRSGTTLVEQILAAHSNVAATDELPYIERIAFELEHAGGYGNRLASLDENQKSRYRQRYRDQARRYLPDRNCHFIDKNPNNFLHVGLIRMLFPEAFIINLRRDLRDNAVSMYRQLFSVGHDYSAKFADIATYTERYLQLMAHWQQLYPDAIRIQSYESLVTNPTQEIAELLAFCQLESEAACFDFHRSKQAVMTPSAAQVSEPMYTSSIGQWQHYEKWLPPEFEKIAVLQKEQSGPGSMA